MLVQNFETTKNSDKIKKNLQQQRMKELWKRKGKSGVQPLKISENPRSVIVWKGQKMSRQFAKNRTKQLLKLDGGS